MQSWAICLEKAGRLQRPDSGYVASGDGNVKTLDNSPVARRSSDCGRCQAWCRHLTTLHPAGAVFYNSDPGTSRLPVRRSSSKFCATLALPRRLRVTGPLQTITTKNLSHSAPVGRLRHRPLQISRCSDTAAGTPSVLVFSCSAQRWQVDM